MPRIDRFLQTLQRLEAAGMTLESGANIVLHFPSGDRHAVQKTAHADLLDLLTEAAPAEGSAALYLEQPTTFPVSCGGVTYDVAVTFSAGRARAEIRPRVERRPRTAPPVDPARYASQRISQLGMAAAEAPEPVGRGGEAVGAHASHRRAEEGDFGGLVQGNTIPGPAESGAAPSGSPEGVGAAEGIPLADPGDLFGAGGSGSASRVGSGSASAAAAAAPMAAPPVAAPASSEALASATPSAASGPTAGGPETGIGAVDSGAGPAGGAVPEPTVAAQGLVDRLLRHMAEQGASDLHLCAASPPYLRLHGEMAPLAGAAPLDAETLYAELYAVMPPKNRVEFAARNDTDFAYEIPGLSRYRVNVFRDRHGPGAVVRAIPFDILTPEQLGLPPQVLKLCDLTKGLVLVTGPTGSGKSTTLAALIDHINRTRSDHIITIEDPIEFVHENKKCLVNQREVHVHTDSFKDALRAALREDPDIVLVGEMRDLETIAIAVETAETGHLVFGTLHTTTAPSTVDRIIDQFPADRQEQIRIMLSESLAGVISQNLCKRIGGGRVAAYEVLLGSKAVSNLIRERKTFQLFSLMQTGKNQGMRTLGDSLIQLVRDGLVAPREAYLKAADKAEFRGLLEREGISLEGVVGA